MGHQPNQEVLQQELAAARRPLDDWRRHKSGRGQIPAAIWEKAVDLAGRHGVGAVAAGLRLDHTKLKSKLAEAMKTATLPVPTQHAMPVQTAFVELFSTSPSTAEAPTQTPTTSRPVVRFKSPHGLQIRLDWGDSDVSGLAKLLKEIL